MNSIKTMIRVTGVSLAVLLTAIITPAQEAVLSGTTDWMGTVDGDFYNPANWSNGVPDNTKDIRLTSAAPNKTLVIGHAGPGDKQVDIYAIRTGLNFAYTLDLQNTSSGTMTLNITGRGAHPFNTDADSTSTGNADNRLKFYINMGSNTRITFAKNVYDANADEVAVPLSARDTSGLLYAWINMTGNSVIDTRDMANKVTISSGTAATGAHSLPPGRISWDGQPRIGGLNIGPDAVVYLGMSAGHLGAALDAGMEEVWEGSLIQDAWDPAKLPSDLYGMTLPDGVTTSMLALSWEQQSTQKWGAGNTRLTATGTVIHPGMFRLRGAGSYYVDGYHEGPIEAATGNSNLGGMGHIKGNVLVQVGSSVTGGRRKVAGVLNPDDIGTLNITGTLTMNLGSTLSIDLADWGQGDKVMVDGGVVLNNSNLAVGWTNENYSLQSGTFRILEATGGITGGFLSAALPQKLRLESRYEKTANAVDIIFTAYPGFAQNPLITGNNNTTASILDDIYAGTVSVPTPVLDTVKTLYGQIDTLPVVYARQAFDQLAPLAYQSWFPAAVTRANSTIQSLEDRLMQDAGYTRARHSISSYVQGWRQQSSRNRDVNAGYSSYDTQAVMVGADYGITENTVAGLYLLHETTEYELDIYGGTSTGKGLTFGAYARHNHGPLQFNAVGLLGTDDYSSTRNIAMTRLGTWARSDVDGTRYGAALSASYTIKLPWLEVAPVTGIQLLNWKADSFGEIGSNGANLIVKSQNEYSFQGRLGMRLSRAFESSYGFIRPYLHMAYVREFVTGNREMEAELLGTSRHYRAPGIEANGMRVDAGVEWQLSKLFRFDLHYTAQYNNACDKSTGVRGGVTFSF